MFDCVLQKNKLAHTRPGVPSALRFLELNGEEEGRRNGRPAFFYRYGIEPSGYCDIFSCPAATILPLILPSSFLPFPSFLFHLSFPFSSSSNNLLKQCFPLALQSTSFSSLFNSTALTHFFFSTFWLPLSALLSPISFSLTRRSCSFLFLSSPHHPFFWLTSFPPPLPPNSTLYLRSLCFWWTHIHFYDSSLPYTHFIPLKDFLLSSSLQSECIGRHELQVNHILYPAVLHDYFPGTNFVF